MKKLLFFALIALLIPFLLAFSWEGELNPDDFDSWEVITAHPTPEGFIWIFIQNPDKTSPIKVVALEVDLEANLNRYWYLKYGELYTYVFNPDIGKEGTYVRRKSQLIPSARI